MNIESGTRANEHRGTAPIGFKLFTQAGLSRAPSATPGGNAIAVTAAPANAVALEEGLLRIVQPVRKTRPFPSRSQSGQFIALQRWEGFVLELKEETFVARLVDLTQPSTDEEAEFPLDEVSRMDLPLVTPGAIFYWSIGYLDHPSGQRTRESMIRFRRLPAWTDQELNDAADRADRISRELSGRESQTA